MNKNAYVSEHGELSTEIMLNVAEILALRLPEGAERIIAAKWVKKFMACDPNTYKDNLSLFVCSLTKQLLVEPFDQAPDEPRDEWKDFAKEYRAADINRAVRDRMYNDAQKPAYKIEMSHDKQEYVAFQEIPLFGAHFYYAFSPTEKIHHWQNFNKLKVPKIYVDALELVEPADSPIKGRISKKPGERVPSRKRQTAHPLAGSSREASKAGGPSARPKTTNLPKPKWEGPIEETEDAAPEKSTKKTMITIPTDGPVKALPPALQRRMVEAERKKQERKALKKKEVEERAERSRSKTPKRNVRPNVELQAPRKSLGGSPGPSTSSAKTPGTSLRRKALNKTSRGASLRDDIDDAADSAREEPEPKLEPVFHGPKNRMELYKEIIEKHKSEIEEFKNSASFSAELAQLPEQILETSNALANEIERIQQQGTSKPEATNAIRDQEVLIGNDLVDILDGSRVQNASVVDEEFRDLLFDLSSVNQTASKPVVSSDTLRRLNELKARALNLSSTESSESVEPQEAIVGNAEKLLGLIGETVEKAQKTITKLHQVEPATAEDERALNDLIIANKNLINNVSGDSCLNPLLEAIQSNSSDLADVAVKVAENLNASINISNEEDVDLVENFVATQAVRKAVTFQDERNDNLERITGRVKAIAAMFEGEYKAQDPIVRQYLGQDDVEEELIDIDEVDFDFEGGTMTDNEFKAQERAANEKLRAEWTAKQNELIAKQKSITSQMFEAIAGETETLDDLTENFQELLDESMDVIDQVIAELDESLEKAADQEQLAAILEVKDRVEKMKRNLENSRKQQTSKSCLNLGLRCHPDANDLEDEYEPQNVITYSDSSSDEEEC